MIAAISERPSRPVIRYHGGKFLLADWIIEHFPKHRTYVEPFGGGGSVLLAKPRAYAEIYNDLNAEVTNLFSVLRNPQAASDLERQLRLTPFSRNEFALSYEPTEDSLELARRLIVRSYMGFGSAAHNAKHATGFRANSNRSGTTPAHDWANYPDVIPSITARLQGVVIENRPAIEVMRQHDGKETLHYCDPPYLPETRKERQRKNYGRFEMSEDDHLKLIECLRALKGMVVLSGYPSSLYEYELGDWKQIERPTLADGARARTEVLWLNPAAQEGNAQQNLFQRPFSSQTYCV